MPWLSLRALLGRSAASARARTCSVRRRSAWRRGEQRQQLYNGKRCAVHTACRTSAARLPHLHHATNDCNLQCTRTQPAHCPHLRLGEVAQREQRACQLLLAQMCQEVRLVLHRIWREGQPHILLLSILLQGLRGLQRGTLACCCCRRCCCPCCGAALQASIVARGHSIKGSAMLLF